MKVYGAHVICLGCRKQIDPLYDNTASDERGRPWHTTCWVERVGAQDTAAHRDGDMATLGASPTLWVGLRVWDKWRRR